MDRGIVAGCLRCGGGAMVTREQHANMAAEFGTEAGEMVLRHEKRGLPWESYRVDALAALVEIAAHHGWLALDMEHP